MVIDARRENFGEGPLKRAGWYHLIKRGLLNHSPASFRFRLLSRWVIHSIINHMFETCGSLDSWGLSTFLVFFAFFRQLLCCLFLIEPSGYRWKNDTKDGKEYDETNQPASSISSCSFFVFLVTLFKVQFIKSDLSLCVETLDTLKELRENAVYCLH